MACVSMTISDMANFLKAIGQENLTFAELAKAIQGKQMKKVSRGDVFDSVSATSDSEDEAATFSSPKAQAFAEENGITDLQGTGKNGKITMEDVKKALPPKKRGRKSKEKPAEIDDLVDSAVKNAKGNFATVKTKAFAEENGITDLQGTSKTGKITMEDVKKAVSAKKKAAKVAAKAAEKEAKKAAKKAKKAAKKKDPNRPKQPTTGYMFWMNNGGGREIVKAENPEAAGKDLMKLAGAKWGSFSSDEQEIWKSKVTVAKEQYVKDLAAYEAGLASPAASPAASPKAAPKSPKARPRLTRRKRRKRRKRQPKRQPRKPKKPRQPRKPRQPPRQPRKPRQPPRKLLWKQ